MAIENAFEIGVRHRVAGDRYSDLIDEMGHREQSRPQSGPLDSEQVKETHRRLLSWFWFERSRQAENRMQMAIDADCYDNMQWDDEDSAEVESRGQVPLVFNEVAPMADWIIGTERRARVDWSVMPRTEDDVQPADAKTKVLKYVSDVNHVQFQRSQAFSDCVKVGVGWVDDGARDDPTQDILYSRYEDWRNVLWDSSGYSLDGQDWRYVFRWRWVDEDVAMAMFPGRRVQIGRSVIDANTSSDHELDNDWYLGEPIVRSGTMYASDNGVSGGPSRPRIRLIECQFRVPSMVRIVGDGPLRGSFISPHDLALQQAVQMHGSSIIEKVVMRTHIAVFTEADMLSMGPSIYRHNRYTLTPLWCYRNGRDRMPYGVIRRVRDLQRDLNKRASKALFLLSTNQIIAEEGSVADKELAREEADRPDGYIEVRKGKEFNIRRDADQATGQIQLMTLDAQAIQRSGGVNNENLGRQTNAISGEAIKARQLQGSVATTEIFDNLRFGVQVQGEKQLSLTEQFYTEEKMIRLSGARGKIEWLRINQPEVQADGSVRYINDITSSASDFVVAEADYAGTLRQVMLDGITRLSERLPPEAALRLFVIAMEFSDLPNKEDIADAVRRIIGERDPNKPMTAEEAQQAEQQMQTQAEALQMQREAATLAIEAQRAAVEKVMAETEEIRRRAEAAGAGVPPEYEQTLRQVQEQATAKLESMAEQLRKAQMDAANKTMAINKDADTKLEAARIQAASNERIAEISKSGQDQSNALMGQLDRLNAAIGEVGKQAKDAGTTAEQAAKAAEIVAREAEGASKKADEAASVAADARKMADAVAKPAPIEKVSPAQAPTPTPVTINFEAGAIQVDAKNPAGTKTITLNAGGQKVTGSIKSDNT